MDFRMLTDDRERSATYAERERLSKLRAQDIQDVLQPPEEAPQEFWETMLQATNWHLTVTDENNDTWTTWADEIRWAQGWSPFTKIPNLAYQAIVGQGVLETKTQHKGITVSIRLSAMEHLMDVCARATQSLEDFRNHVNDRARWFRVGLRLEDKRFIAVASEHLHTEIVQPVLLLLADPQLSAVDALYRKAFNRALAGDPAGAVTVAVSAVEELLRIKLGTGGSKLDALLRLAQSRGAITPATQQIVSKLSALRVESDAHSTGTNEFDVAMFALHLVGSSLLYLGRIDLQVSY